MTTNRDFFTVNPATGEQLKSYSYMHKDELIRALKQSKEAAEVWRRKSVGERCLVLRQMSERLKVEKGVLAQLVTTEMGKPIREATAEIEKSAFCLETYAAHAETWARGYDCAAPRAVVTYEPLGTILAIMPWNFPVWQVIRAATPLLSAGNVMLLKHAENVTGVAAALTGFMEEAAGLPLITMVRVSEADCAALIQSPDVHGVTLTGSPKAGRAVAATAGAALKKVVLELGGSDPYLVLDDADVGLAARVAAASRLINGGQSCVAAKRFIVDETVLEHFTAALVSEFKRRVVGDPTKLETAIGPLARDDLRLTLDRQVQRSVAMGAKVLLGGHFEKKAAGFFYPPTILTAVAPGMPAFDEELFGPVATVTSCRGDADAIRLANHSRFGLGSAVFSQDLTRAHTVARALNTGMTAINQMVVSDPRLPFGGIGESGIGVELGREGIFEFTRPKVIIAEASV